MFDFRREVLPYLLYAFYQLPPAVALALGVILAVLLILLARRLLWWLLGMDRVLAALKQRRPGE